MDVDMEAVSLKLRLNKERKKKQTMKRSFVIMLMILLVSSLIFSGCAKPAPSPAPAPAPAPTTAPSPAPAPAPVKPIELKLANNAPPNNNPNARFMMPWAKKIEEATNGRVKITIYPAETLLKSKETVVGTQQGIADLSWVLIGMYPGRFSLTEVTSLPFLNLPYGTVEGRKLGPGGINSHIIQELFESSPEMQKEWSDVKMLIMHTAGASFLFTKKPVRNLDEIKGLKLRGFSGPDIEMWQMLGAAPIAMPLPNVYEAAEKGVLEATAVDWGGIESNRLYEVFKYRTNAEFTLGRYALVMNLEKWNSLPPDIQKTIISFSGIRGAELAGDALCDLEAVDKVRAMAKQAGKTIEEVELDPGEFDKWKQIIQPIYDKWVADMTAKGLPGQKLLDAARSLVAKYK